MSCELECLESGSSFFVETHFDSLPRRGKMLVAPGETRRDDNDECI